jgi:hypothetical protein
MVEIAVEPSCEWSFDSLRAGVTENDPEQTFALPRLTAAMWSAIISSHAQPYERAQVMTYAHSDLLRYVSIYQELYRSSTQVPFEIGPPYDLFPLRGPEKTPCGGRWPESWPHLSRAGVYAFLSDEGELLYIGKASFRNSLAARLSTYCGYEAGPGTPCRLYHQWKTNPRYVVTIAVPESTRFEASALEEFLIGELQPPENSIGLNRNA